MNLRVAKKEDGIGIIDVILIVLIICCSIFIYIVIAGNNKPVENANEGGKEFNTSSEAKKNTKDTENITSNILNANLNNYSTGNIDTNIQDSANSYKRYFYNQLNSNAKSLYTQIVDNFDLIKAGDKVINFSADTVEADKNFQSAWDAFMLDNPGIFYVNTNNITLETKSDKKIWGKPRYSYKLMPKQGKKYYFDTWKSQDELEKSIKEVDEKVNMILTGAKGSRYDKVKYIHDYIVDNAEYDKTDDINNGDIYGMLINESAVCEGYSKAFQYLLNLLDIPNIIVYGDGVNSNNESEFHSWNYVEMDDGKWYAVDTTWDDPIIIGNGVVAGDIKHEYFLKGSNSFFERHKENSDVSGTGQNFKYIEISKTDYK